MNLVYGKVLETFDENGLPMAKIRVGGALKNVPLALLPDVQCGDRILICDGVAIAKIQEVRNHDTD